MVYLPEHLVLALCGEHRGDPGDLTWERIEDMDRRCAAAFDRLIDRYTAGLDQRSRSLIMLIAVLSEFDDPEDSVPEACNVYRNASEAELFGGG